MVTGLEARLIPIRKITRHAIDDFVKALERKAPNPDEILNNRG